MYRDLLKQFREVYPELDALQKADLLGYVVGEVTLTGAEIKFALLGQPEGGRLDDLLGDPKLGQPEKWLPVLD